MSSPADLQPSRFLSRWMPSSSRAGVILTGSAGDAPSVRSSLSSPGPEFSVDDSFSSHFAPLPVSPSSSGGGLGPLRGEESRVEAEVSGYELDGVLEILRREPELPIIAKLEQLKQLQQRMQAQLKSHQLEQLQKVQNEQQRPQPATEYAHENKPSHPIIEASQPLQTAYRLPSARPALPQIPERHQQSEAEETLESGVWNYEASEASRYHSGGEDEDHNEESLQSMNQDHRSSGETEPEDRPIRSGVTGKTFEEMLEEQLKLENEKQSKGAHTEAVKVKKPFLKRGEGLSRFTKGRATLPPKSRTTQSNTKAAPHLDLPPTRGPQQSNQLKKPSTKPTKSTSVAIQRKTAVLSKENLPQSRTSVPATKPLAKPQVLGVHQGQNLSSQQLSKNERKLEPQQVDVGKAKLPEEIPNSPQSNAQTNVAENSFDIWLSAREREHRRECKELDEFELLEKAADEFSFSSNSSFVGALLRKNHRRLSSTPVKSPPRSAASNRATEPEGPSHGGARSSPEICGSKGTKHETAMSERPKGESSPDPRPPSVPPIDPFGLCFQTSEPPYDKRTYQDRYDIDSRGEEEEEGEDGEVEEEGSDQGDSTLVNAKPQVEFDDDETWNDLDDSTCSSSRTDSRPPEPMLTRKIAVSKGVEVNGRGHISTSSREPAPPSPPPPTCQLVAKLFPALKPKPNPSPPPPAPHPATTEQDGEDAQGEEGAVRSRLLRERLVELETEIERFKRENAALSRIRLENQEIGETLRKERAEFQQKMAEERARWEELKREESRKLQREKKLFEKHAAAARSRPDKQERDEIQSLKQQLNSLQEDFKRRESRWSGTHARLRQQLDALNGENAALRDQVRMLEKLRLGVWKNAENERERGRSVTFASTNNAGSRRTKSKSPSSSNKPSPPQSSSSSKRKESPEIPVSQKSSFKPKAASPDNPKSHGQKDARPADSPNPVSKGGASFGRREDSPQMPNTLLVNSESESREDLPDRLEMDSEFTHADGKIEKVLPDGGRLTVFPNGTRKDVSADGLSAKVTFFNGDVKRVMPDQRVIYYYAESQTTHTTYPDGMEVLQFRNNQIEKHFPDGRKEITFPDQTVKNLYPDGREESVLADGTIVQQNPDGSKEIRFNTGQRELHTAHFKRREYPDGTVKTVYSDGRQETRYPTGRVRLKDAQGRITMATGT